MTVTYFTLSVADGWTTELLRLTVADGTSELERLHHGTWAASPDHMSRLRDGDACTIDPAGASALEATLVAEAAARRTAVAALLASASELAGADLTNVNLDGIDLSGKMLNGARFWNTDLRGADLSGSSLTGADFTDADLSGADLSEAKLVNAHFIGAKLIDADLSDANLALANVTDADFSNADLTDTDFTDANIAATTFTGAVFADTICPDGSATQDGLGDAWNDPGEDAEEEEEEEEEEEDEATEVRREPLYRGEAASGGEIYIDLVAMSDGSVVIAGQDLGTSVDDDSDYEYWLTIPAEARDELLFALILDRLKGDPTAVSTFKAWLAERSIANSFHSF